MNYEDKLLGVAISGEQTTRTYSAFKIDYDSEKKVSDLLGEGETVEDYFTGQLKTTPSGYVLVEDATTRDEVQALLDENSITYETTDVAPTEAEKDAIEYYDVTNGREIEEAVQKHHSSLNRSRISQASKDKLRTDIGNISDADAKQAIEDIFEILTGETL